MKGDSVFNERGLGFETAISWSGSCRWRSRGHANFGDRTRIQEIHTLEIHTLEIHELEIHELEIHELEISGLLKF